MHIIYIYIYIDVWINYHKVELSTERFSLLANQNHGFGCFGCFGMFWHRGHPRGASKHQSGHGTVTWRCILQDSLDEETE
jgi:hypothetical protein